MIAHLNHHLRGRSSDADAQLVRRAGRRLGHPVIVGHANVKALARTGKVSIEMAGRQARHNFLAAAAHKAKCSWIALAHHADDQVELFFLRLFRGAGVDSLAGMKKVGISPNDPSLNIIRPLLSFPKEALAQFARGEGIAYCEDASNASLEMGRNRIRHELLPLIRKHYQPAIRSVIIRTMEILQAEATSWRPSQFAGEEFDSLPVAIQRRCLHQQLLARGMVPDFELVEKLRLNPDQRVSLPNQGAKKLQASRDRHGRVQFLEEADLEFDPESKAVAINGPAKKVGFGELKFSWAILSKRGAARPAKGGAGPTRGYVELFDADKVGKRITLRHWQPGDRFQPIGMSSAVKLQDLLVNKKIPAQKRRKLTLATTAKGRIFWVEGMRIAEPFRLTQRTRRRLRWRWQRV
jgi:tRNA(Ile)-lysidine synthase